MCTQRVNGAATEERQKTNIAVVDNSPCWKQYTIARENSVLHGNDKGLLIVIQNKSSLLLEWRILLKVDLRIPKLQASLFLLFLLEQQVSMSVRKVFQQRIVIPGCCKSTHTYNCCHSNWCQTESWLRFDSQLSIRIASINKWCFDGYQIYF